jgi:NADPH-dependent curcumin reductase CurA
MLVDRFDRYPETLREIAALHAKGRLRWRYRAVDGLGRAADAVRLLFQWRNR